MEDIVNLTSLLRTTSTEPNAAIRQAAEAQLQSTIDLRPETHEKIVQFALSDQEESSKVLLLVFVKKMLTNEQAYAYSKNAQENLKRIAEIYRNFLFKVASGSKKSQIAAEILLESLNLISSTEFYEQFEAEIWARIVHFTAHELSTGIFMLRAFYKNLQSKLFASSFAIIGRLQQLLTTGERILHDFFALVDSSTETFMDEGIYTIIYEYLKLLKLLRNGLNVVDDSSLSNCLEQLACFLNRNFNPVNSRSQRYSGDLEFIAFDTADKIATKIGQIKTLIFKILKSIDKANKHQYVKVTQNSLIYASTELSQIIQLGEIPSHRVQLLDAYVVSLLDFLTSKVENLEFNNFYSGSLGATVALCLKIIILKSPSLQFAESGPQDYMDVLENAIGHNNLSCVLNSTTIFFTTLCDRYEALPLSAFNYIQGKLADCFVGNLQPIAEFGGNPLNFLHASLLILAAMHVTLNMKPIIISKLANFILDKKQQLTMNSAIFADLTLLFKVYASDFVEEKIADNSGQTIFFGMLELLFTNLKTKPSELIELSSSRALEHIISKSVLDDSPGLEALLSEKADLIFTQLSEIYLMEKRLLKGDLIRSFYESFGKKVSFNSVASMIGALNTTNFKELESSTDNLIDLVSLISALITWRNLTPQESEFLDTLMMPFLNYFYDNCPHKDLLEDNICQMLHQATVQIKSCSKLRIGMISKIKLSIQKDAALFNDYFEVLNAFLVYGKHNFDVTSFTEIFELAIRNTNKTLNIFVLCSLIQNLGHFFTSDIFRETFARAGMLVPDLASQPNKDLQRGIVFLYVNSLVFVPHHIHDLRFSNTFFTVINSFVLNQNLFFKSEERKIVCLSLISLARSSVYGEKYEQLMLRIIISIYDHISMLGSIKETERLSAKKTKRVSQKVGRPLEDFSSSEVEDEDEEGPDYRNHYSQAFKISKFINAEGIPDHLQVFKEFCKDFKNGRPDFFENLVKRRPVQVASFLKDIFRIEAVPLDKGSTVFENRKIVRLKK